MAFGGVSLEVRRGEFLAILGTSGSGKTTLLRLVNRLIDPSSGEVIVSGKPTTEWDTIALRRSMGYVIQEGGPMPHMSILANVGLVPRIKGEGKTEQDEATRRCLSMVGIDPQAMGGRFPHQLSGGQRQRVGVARTLAADPHLILMDQPFGALDPITRREVQDEFRSLQRDLGMTVILVTHDLSEACRMADRLALVPPVYWSNPVSPSISWIAPPATSPAPSSRTPGPSRPSTGDLGRDLRTTRRTRRLLRAGLRQRRELLQSTAAHLDLVGDALLIAVCLGVPLGIPASRSRPSERGILTVANVLQTISSLALLGVLLALFRGQVTRAIAALICCRQTDQWELFWKRAA